MKIEEKVNAIINYILAETAEEKEKYVALLKNEDNENTSNKNAEKEIANILCEIGVPEHIKGHRYSAYAIKVAVENPDIIDAIMKELYPTVGVKFNTTVHRVERAIRHGI